MARKFVFKLESLRRLREFEEDRARRELFAVLAERRRLERELDELIRAREEAKTRCRLPEGEVDVERIVQLQRHVNVLYGRLVRKQEEIIALEPRVREAARRLREAGRRRKTVDKLRERRLEEHRLEEARAEIRELDEVGQIYGSALGDDARRRAERP